MNDNTLRCPLTVKQSLLLAQVVGSGAKSPAKCAADGANLVILGKTSNPHPTLEGTIFSVAKEVEAAGGHALPIELDLRDDEKYAGVIAQVMDRFGGIHALINNASALFMAKMNDTPTKKYDLINGVNGRATFLFTQACLPHLLNNKMSDVITISPPLNLSTKEFGKCPAYTISKYNMSMVTLALSQAHKRDGLRANSLWPKNNCGHGSSEKYAPKTGVYGVETCTDYGRCGL